MLTLLMFPCRREENLYSDLMETQQLQGNIYFSFPLSELPRRSSRDAILNDLALAFFFANIIMYEIRNI